MVVSPETRRLLIELMEDEDDGEEAMAPIADFVAFRARKAARLTT